MKNTAILFVSALALTTCGMKPAAAQLGSLLREGLEAAVKGSAQVAAKGAQESLEFAAPKVSNLLSRGVTEAVEGTAKASAGAARVASREVFEAAAKHGDDVFRPIVSSFGDDGARAISSLSEDSAAKLSSLAPDLAKNPMASDWISTIAKHGDAAVSWLWNRRLSIAVGTTATAVLLQPQEFIEAGEHVATTAITTAGQHFVQPMILETADHVVEPLIHELSKPIANAFLPIVVFTVVVAVAACVGWLCWQKVALSRVK